MPMLNIAADENTEACWTNLQEGLKLLLISGGKEALEFFYLWKNDRNHLLIARHHLAPFLDQLAPQSARPQDPLACSGGRQQRQAPALFQEAAGG